MVVSFLNFRKLCGRKLALFLLKCTVLACLTLCRGKGLPLHATSSSQDHSILTSVRKHAVSPSIVSSFIHEFNSYRSICSQAVNGRQGTDKIIENKLEIPHSDNFAKTSLIKVTAINVNNHYCSISDNLNILITPCPINSESSAACGWPVDG